MAEQEAQTTGDATAETGQGEAETFVPVGSLVTARESAAEVDMPVSEPLSGPENAPLVLDRWRVWIGLAVAVIIFVYVPTLISVIQSSAWNAPGFPIR